VLAALLPSQSLTHKRKQGGGSQSRGEGGISIYIQSTMRPQRFKVVDYMGGGVLEEETVEIGYTLKIYLRWDTK